MPYVLAGMVFYAAADLSHAPLSNALSAAAAPPEQRGRSRGIQVFLAFANIPAPTFFTARYGRGSVWPWLAVAVLAIAATVTMYALHGPLAAREKPRLQPLNRPVQRSAAAPNVRSQRADSR